MNGEPTPIPTIPGNTVSDIINEVPIELFFLAIGVSIALLAFLMWLAYSKNKNKPDPRKETIDRELAQNARPAPVQATAPTQHSFTDDMPDLDDLLDPTNLMMGPQQPPAQPLTPPTPAKREPVQRVRLHTGAEIEVEELVVVLRDPRDGRLVVQIDDIGYRTLVESPDAKKKFVQVMKSLSEVVTKPDDNPPAIQAQPPPIQPQLTSKQPVAPPPPPPLPDGDMPGDMPKFRLTENVIPTAGDKRDIPELDLAGAIEAYLQHKLHYTPQYANREIHVRSAPGGGVLVQVDANFYDAVGDIAEVDVRQFLQMTIQEWQKRQRR